MSSEIKADKWSPASGTSATIGDSGDTYTVPSGVTLNTSSATLTLPSTVITGQTAKTSLVDADKFLISDSAASGALKYVESQYIGGGTLVQTAKVFYEASQSSNNVTLTNAFTDDYDHYVMFLALTPSTNAAGLYMRFRNNSGTQITGSNYDYAARFYFSDNVTSQEYGEGTDKIVLIEDMSSNPTDSPFVGTFWFNINKNHGTPSQMASFNVHGQYLVRTSNSNRRITTAHLAAGYRDSNTNNEARDLKLYMSTGNVEQVNARIYGIKDSNS